MRWWRVAILVPAMFAQTAGTALSTARELLAAHNAVRRKVGVDPLVWSVELEAAAREWAQHLIATGKFTHRPRNPRGENLFEIRGGRASVAMVMQSWAEEEADFDPETNTCRPGAVCGHYTQIVWRNTKAMGCAVARMGRREVWVCEYDPAGNWVGQRPY